MQLIVEMTWITIKNLKTKIYLEGYKEGGFDSNFLIEKKSWIIN